MHSIADLSRARALLPGAASEAFFSLYEVHDARASCVQPPALQAKYGAAESQSVVSVSSVPLAIRPGIATSASTMASATNGGRPRASAVARNSLRT